MGKHIARQHKTTARVVVEDIATAAVAVLAVVAAAAGLFFALNVQEQNRLDRVAAMDAANDRPTMVPHMVTGDYYMVPAADAVPCEYEDSRGCVWVAADRGNGVGRSFHATAGGAVTPLADDVARGILAD